VAVRFSQERLNVWIYKFLLGTLPTKEVLILREEVKRRYQENQIHSAIETKLVDAFTDRTDEQAKKRLAELLDDWGKRNWAD